MKLNMKWCRLCSVRQVRKDSLCEACSDLSPEELKEARDLKRSLTGWTSQEYILPCQKCGKYVERKRKVAVTCKECKIKINNARKHTNNTS